MGSENSDRSPESESAAPPKPSGPCIALSLVGLLVALCLPLAFILFYVLVPMELVSVERWLGGRTPGSAMYYSLFASPLALVISGLAVSMAPCRIGIWGIVLGTIGTVALVIATLTT